MFSGDGMVYAFDFSAGKAKLRSRFAKPYAYFADRGAPESEYPFFSRLLARFNLELGFRESLNTAFVATDDKLLVTTDGGRPYILDETTLKTKSPVAKIEEWFSASAKDLEGSTLFPNIFSTAHPFWDHEEKSLYTVHYSAEEFKSLGWKVFTDLIRWDGKEKFEKCTE